MYIHKARSTGGLRMESLQRKLAQVDAGLLAELARRAGLVDVLQPMSPRKQHEYCCPHINVKGDKASRKMLLAAATETSTTVTVAAASTTATEATVTTQKRVYMQDETQDYKKEKLKLKVPELTRSLLALTSSSHASSSFIIEYTSATALQDYV